MIPVAFMCKQMQQRCLINKLYLVHFELLGIIHTLPQDLLTLTSFH